MKELSKIVTRQDANFKLTPSTSNETSINLSNEISVFIADQSGEVTFKLYRNDFIKAISALCLIPKIFKKKNQDPSNPYEIFTSLFSEVQAQFGDADSSYYTIYLFKRDDGRAYFNNLKASNGFNLRSFLVEQFSNLRFQKNDGGELTIRLDTILPEEQVERIKAEVSADILDAADLSYSCYLAAMRTKPFLLLAGISGTGKSRIVKEMAFASCPPSLRKDDVTPGNYCMIEVKPNWHDSTELIGYVSSIPKPHYVVTPFINFLIKAMHYPKAPFFVCLDEMNLAPVEQYFAEFLSVLESRKLVNGEIVSEPLIKPGNFSKYFNDFKHHYFTAEDLASGGLIPERYAELWKDLGDNGLRLPPNVIVIGTVNMDDTTYQFSRKVIDRAMTIEMNDVDYGSMFDDAPDTLKYRGDDYVKAVNFLPKYTAAKDVLNVLNDADREYLKQNVPTILKSLDVILFNTPFRIAYRVENELILYFAALREEQPEANAEALLATAVDDILMMKVLPRIEGNEDVLTDPLSRLENFTRETYPKAHGKVGEMQARLEANHFTSFWP